MVLLTLPLKPSRAPRPAIRQTAHRLAVFTVHLLDFTVALGRKIAGFCALLTLGWIYFRYLVLHQSLHRIYAGAPDPDLRDTIWTALLLVLAQGWDIPTDEIAVFWARLRGDRPDRGPAAPMRLPPQLRSLWCAVEPIVGHLGRFMDLCVAIANKVGALAVLGFVAFLLWQFGVEHVTLRHMYPQAQDPTISLLADVCVYVVVLGWWAMPMEQIRLFWQRLRGSTVE